MDLPTAEFFFLKQKQKGVNFNRSTHGEKSEKKREPCQQDKDFETDYAGIQ